MADRAHSLRLVISTLVQAADGAGMEPELLVVDPRHPARIERLDLPGTRGRRRRDGRARKIFVTSAVGDIDGDGRDEIVCGLTPGAGGCSIVAYRPTGEGWTSEPVAEFARGPVGFIRSLATGDLDGDGRDEIVVGTRPNGLVLLLDRARDAFASTTLDADAYGPGTSNTREVLVADVDGDGRPEVLAATARADGESWAATPGGLFAFQRPLGPWTRTVVDDLGSRTHSRMIVAGDLLGDGRTRLVANTVGVYDWQRGVLERPSGLRLYEVSPAGIRQEPIDTLGRAVKARGLAIGDVDGEGRNALLVGTRGIEAPGFDETFLYCYRHDPAAGGWRREIVATTGPRGFHCVAVVDVEGNGRGDVIASDDGMGQICRYRRAGGVWRRRVIVDYPRPIFVTRIDTLRLPASGDA